MITYEEVFEIALAEARRVGLPWEGGNILTWSLLDTVLFVYAYCGKEIYIDKCHFGKLHVSVSLLTGKVISTGWSGIGFPDTYDPPPPREGWIRPREARDIAIKEMKRIGWGERNYNVHWGWPSETYKVSNPMRGFYASIEVHPITGEILEVREKRNRRR